MKHLYTARMACLSCLFIASSGDAAEGRLSDAPPPALDASRVSNYSGEPAVTATDAQMQTAPKDSGVRAHSKAAGSHELRPLATTYSHRSSYFYIYDAGSSLRRDRDGDGYHSEFRIRFDADFELGDALVYARLYLRRLGESEWLLYHTTDDFWIYGQSGGDDYYVTTTLDDGFATAEYDVLIDLYEAGYAGIVATLGPADSGALGYLPLEEAGLDVPIEIDGYGIRGVSTTLLIDSDGDGHYSRFRVAFDPHAMVHGSLAYVRVWVRPQGGEWIEEFVSEDFLVHAVGDADVYAFTADWISGYPTAYYDVQIDLYDAATGLLAASSGSERPQLSRIPLEDQSRDLRVNPPDPGAGGGSSRSREHGGGALSRGWALALALLALVRRTRAGRSRR